MSPGPDEIQAVQQTQSHPAIPAHLQNTPAFQHINHAPSASPPIHHGMTLTRHGTPQPQVTSRPSSRNHIRRVSSNLGPQQHGTPPPPPPPGSQNGNFGYMPNPSMYNPNVHAMNQQPQPGQFAHYGHQPRPHQGTPPMHTHALPQQMPSQHQAQQHFQQHGHPVGMPSQVQQVYMQEHGRGSLPPGFAPDGHQDRPVSEHTQEEPSGLKPEHSQSPPQIKSLSKSRSIFTPIDDRGSVLARHFGAGAPTYEPPRNTHSLKVEPLPQGFSNSRSIPVRAATEAPRSGSESKPSRTSSGPLPSKRPQLKVQIPSEHSDGGGSATAESSRDSSGNKSSTPAKTSAENGGSGVVLPPPSPSAGAILSAGAQGPPNPFARPPPPVPTTRNDSYGSNSGNPGNVNNSNNIETPISALPSRFVSDALLPSPSSFFPEWGFGRSGPDSNMLPSPLTFPTPAVQSGPSFSREDEQDKKRKSPEGGSGGESANKKPKI
jgi:MADS-box transcription factor